MNYIPYDSSRLGAAADSPFPRSPIAESEHIRPLDTWAQIHRECQPFGLELDAFWYEAVRDGICYLFCWVGPSPAIVLVVLEDNEITWIESKVLKPGDCDDSISKIEATVLRAFRESGIELRRPAMLQ